jgi:transposase
VRGCRGRRQDSAEFRDRLLLLPRFAPDGNPISPAFAKVEPARRRAAARFVEALVVAA